MAAQSSAPLKKGQKVLVKANNFIEGEVVSRLLADVGTPENEEIYKIQITGTRYVRRNELELWPDPAAKPVRGSQEWATELTRFNELGRQCLAKPDDKALVKQLAECGSKLGFFVPIA